jgi:hypothetical protein
MHWRLLPSYFPQPVPAKRVWNRVNSIQLAGRTVPELCDEDLLLFLCCHGTKHLWERLGWICDIARLIQVRCNLDWDLLWRNAREQRCRRILLLGLALANEVLGMALPADLIQRISDHEIVSTRVQLVRSRLFAGLPSPPPGAELVRFTLPLLETVGDKLRYLHGLVLAPTEAEFEALQLPPALGWAYYPFRFLRLSWKHAFC